MVGHLHADGVEQGPLPGGVPGKPPLRGCMMPGIIEWKTGAPGCAIWIRTSAETISASPATSVPGDGRRPGRAGVRHRHEADRQAGLGQNQRRLHPFPVLRQRSDAAHQQRERRAAVRRRRLVSRR